MTDAIAPDGGRDSKRSDPPSKAVIEAVAEKTETDSEDLPALYNAVDPDALDQLFTGRESGTVTFSCCGCEITVEQNGEITLYNKE